MIFGWYVVYRDRERSVARYNEFRRRIFQISLKDVLDRHYPKMTEKWMNSSSAFSVWDSSPQPYNPIPLYLRLPQQ